MVNRIVLIGRLGIEPEMSYLPSGTAITKFTLAVNRRQRSKEGGERQEETDWFHIVAWEKLAEICNNYLHKGSKVFIEGRMQSRKYTDKNGVERISWEVIASDMQMLDPKGSTPARSGAAEGGYADAGEQSSDDIPF
jgi:single-strand DNA-binding protein